MLCNDGTKKGSSMMVPIVLKSFSMIIPKNFYNDDTKAV